MKPSRGTYKSLLLLLVVLPGVCGVCVFGWYALIDWKALQSAYASFASVAETSVDMPSLFVAEAKQNIHRINLFADGVWCLLSAILAAIGLHGLAVSNGTPLAAKSDAEN